MARPPRKRVKIVYLHKPLFWPGIGGADGTTLSSEKIKGLEMWIDGDFLFCSAKGKVVFTHIINIATGVPDLIREQEAESE